MSDLLSWEDKTKNITDEEDSVFFKLEYLARSEINDTKNSTTFGNELSAKQFLRSPKRYDDYLASISSKFKLEDATENNLMDDFFQDTFDSEALIFISNEKQSVSDGYSGRDYEKPHNTFTELTSRNLKVFNKSKEQFHETRNETKTTQKTVFQSKPRSKSQVLWRRGKAGSSIDDSDASTIASVGGFSQGSTENGEPLFGDTDMLINYADENVNKETNAARSSGVFGDEDTSKMHSIDVTEISNSLKKALENCTSSKMPLFSNKPQKTVDVELPGKCTGDCRQQNMDESSRNSWSNGSEQKKSKSQTHIPCRQFSDTKLADKRKNKKCVKCFLCCGKGVFPLSESIRAGLTYSVNPYPRMHCPRALEPCDACATRIDEEKDSSKPQKKDYSRMTKVERKKELQRIYGIRLSDRQARVNQTKLRRPEWVF